MFCATTQDTVAQGRIAKGPLTLQIQGRAFTAAGPLVGASVTGMAGTTAGEAVTNASGDYSMSLSFAATDSLARLTVRGAGGQSHVEFTTVPGSYSMLAATAGDGTLTRSEDPYVDLTPHTTAVYLAMTAITPLDSEAAWQQAQRSFVPQDVVQRGAVLGGLADSLVPLPAGTTTTLEAASQLAGAQATYDALFEFDGTCRTAPICAMEDQLFMAPIVPVRPAPPLDVEYRIYIPFGQNGNAGYAAVLLSTGGTGTLRMASSGPGADFTLNDPTAIEWEVVGDVLRVHRADDAPLASFQTNLVEMCAGEVEALRVTDTLALRLRYLFGPGGSMLLQIGDEQRATFPGTPACPQIDTPGDPAFFHRVISPSEVPVPLTDPSGKILFLLVCETACGAAPTHDGAADNRAAEPHQFNPGGTGTQLRLGRSFTWSLTGGRLSLAYSNGHTAEFTQASDERPGIGTAVTRYVDSTAVTYIASGTIVAKDPAASFGTSVSTAAAAFDTKINRMYPYGRVLPSQRAPFGFQLFSDGTGTRLNNSGFIRWYVENGGDRIRHERFANSGSAVLQQRRLWEVIRIDGDEVLLLENSDLTPPTPLTYTPTPRLFAYVRTTFPVPGSEPDAAVALPAPGNAGDGTGSAVAIGGDFIVVGSPDAAVSGADAGAVYVFRKPTAAAAAVVGKDGRMRFTTKGLELVATLSSPTPTIGDKWGTSVTISSSGDQIAIGAPGTDGEGEVAVFEKPEGDWTSDSTPDVTLAPPTVGGATVEDFGASVAMTDSGALAVGAPGTDIGSTSDAGFAAVYVPSGGTYGTPQQILPVDGQDGGGFGSVVAASDSLLAIGAPAQDGEDGTRDAGAVYAYTTGTPGTSYNLSATLVSPTTTTIGDKWGTSVDVSGGTLLIGAPGTDTSRGPDTGAGYIYESAGLAVPTTPTTELLPQGISGDASGTTVSLVDGVALLGAPLATREGEYASGTAFIFRRPGTTWSEVEELASETELLPTRPQANQYYGGALALSQDLIVAGAPNRDLEGEEGQGEAEAIVLDRIFRGTFE